MKVTEEREKLESLLNASSNSIEGEVPLNKDIPKEIENQPTMGIDFIELRDQCNNEARTMLNNAIGFILDKEIINDNEYLKNKLEVDIMSLSGMIYQLRVNEAMQTALMNEVDRGMIHPRMFEVFSGLSKTIADINKQLIGTVEAIKSTYKDVKQDVQEKKAEANAISGTGHVGMLTTGDGGVTSMGTKDLIQKIKREKAEALKQSNQDVDDVTIINDMPVPPTP